MLSDHSETRTYIVKRINTMSYMLFSPIFFASIGLGMVSRGEVALIVAQKGSMAGLISGTMFPAVVLMVIVTTLVTPLLLKVGMKRPTPDNTEPTAPANA